MVDLPQYGNVFPDDILARLRDLESAVNDLQDGTFQAVVTLDGDVTGQSSTTVVEAVQGQPISAAAPSEHDVLSAEYNDDGNLVWTPGDVMQIGGRLVVFNNPEPGAFLEYNEVDYFSFAESVSSIWGSGIDGSAPLNSANTMPDWADRTGSGNNTVITLLRDVYCTNLSLTGTGSEGATTFYNIAVDTNGFRIFCTDTLTLTAGVTLRNNGGDASGSTAGMAGTENTLKCGKDGGAGSSSTGASGSGSSKSIAAFDPSASYGGAGGSATGGPGVGGGTAGGSCEWYASDGSPYNIMQAVSVQSQATDKFEGGAGGSGGNGSSGTGGGGGAGGGIVAIYARKLVNNGTIQANGGNGGDATGTNGGGGGGGGGGAVIAVYLDDRSTIGTVQVSGGTGGSAIGTGKDGADGDDGYFWDIAL